MEIRGFRARVGAAFPDEVRIKRKEILPITTEQAVVIETGRSGDDDTAASASDTQETSVE